jgi:hypothetical protein
MSKKKPQTKSKNSQLLDVELQDTVQEQEVVPQSDGTVNLDEFSRTGPFAFNKVNTKFLLIGLAINIIGYILMIGGATDDITQFDGDALFSETRITVAPFFIVIGYIVMLYAVMKKPKVEA